jgi:CHAT domain-containing protein
MFFLTVFILNLTVFAQNCHFINDINTIQLNIDKGDFDEATKKINQLLLCKNLSDTELAKVYAYQYKNFRNNRKYKKALKAILKEEVFHQSSNDRNDTNFYLRFTEIHALLKDSLNYKKHLIKINVNEEASINKGHLFFVKFLHHYNLDGNFDAISNLQNALTIFENNSEKDIYYFGNTLRHLGNYNRTNGDFEKAIDFYTRELNVYKKQYKKNHFDIAVCHYNIGSVLYEKLNYKKALEHYLIAHQIWNKTKKPTSGYMRYLNEAIGDMYWELNDKENALKYFDLATTKEKIINNDVSENSIKKGTKFLKDKNYNLALQSYNDAFERRKKLFGENHFFTGACKNFIARTIDYSGDIEGALTAYQEAINILVTEMHTKDWYTNPTLVMHIQSYLYLLESLKAKGELLKKLYHKTSSLKDLETALKTQEIAIQVLEVMKNNDMSDNSKVFWTKNSLILFENSINTAYQLFNITKDKKYLEKAFNFSERSKSLLLLSSLHGFEINSFSKLPNDVLLTEKSFKKSINEYVGKINNEEKRCTKVREKMLTIWKEKLQKLYNQYDVFLNELKQNYPDYYQLKFEFPIASVKQVQQQILTKKSMLISYFLGKNKCYVFNISKTDFQLREINKNIELELLITEYYKQLIDYETTQIKPQKQFLKYQRLAYKLYETLLEPELKSGNPKNIFEELIIIPDGKLAYIPFESLLTINNIKEKRTYKSLPYLLKQFAISYSPSASVKLLFNKQTITSNRYFGFAPNYQNQYYKKPEKSLKNLKYNETEVDYASKLFNGKKWLAKNATEDQLKNSVSKACIVHFAMHGEVDDEFPLLSKLYFNTSKENDGKLHTYEIYNLDLQAQLVILSACNTANGKLERGEGIMSLERAFQYAGSSAILSTLWTVDDESTTKLTQLFLKNIKEGFAKDVALQQAKLSYLETASPEVLHPYFWSSFKLTGNTASLKNSNLKTIIWIGILTLFGLFFIWKYRHNN